MAYKRIYRTKQAKKIVKNEKLVLEKVDAFVESIVYLSVVYS